jgi:hypothetical protein
MTSSIKLKKVHTPILKSEPNKLITLYHKKIKIDDSFFYIDER